MSGKFAPFPEGFEQNLKCTQTVLDAPTRRCHVYTDRRQCRCGHYIQRFFSAGIDVTHLCKACMGLKQETQEKDKRHHKQLEIEVASVNVRKLKHVIKEI